MGATVLKTKMLGKEQNGAVVRTQGSALGWWEYQVVNRSRG